MDACWVQKSRVNKKGAETERIVRTLQTAASDNIPEASHK